MSSGQLRDGVVERGATWSYVVRVPDPVTGRTRPKWVGGFATEDAAKAAGRGRVAARRGEYIDRAAITVREYLSEWLDTHANSVKPQTLAGYRYNVERYVVPYIGNRRLQGLRPADVSKMYLDLSSSGGKGGRPLSARSIDAVHRTLRKALNDAVRVEQLLASNPAERAKRPRSARNEIASVWTNEQLHAFLTQALKPPAARLLSAGRLHRSKARRAAQSAMVGPGPRRARDGDHRVRHCGRRAAGRGIDQGGQESRRFAGCRHRGRSAGASGATARRKAQDGLALGGD
ncbi:MAG: hypothetical protein H0W95_03465 [Nocardioidaceae bacterium]|nr:hypothetical protein [Nocardioidaceae bacterium]